MLVPLGILTVGAVFAGFVFTDAFVDSAEFWGGSIFYNDNLIHALHEVPLWVKLSATIAMLIGLFGAWLAYIRDPSIPGKFVARFSALHNFVFNKWYFDELYRMIFIKPAFWFGRKFWIVGDENIINRFGPDGAAWVVAKGSIGAKRVQSGYLNSYALIMLLGLIGAISWVMI